MYLSGIVDPDQLAMLAKVLDDHCHAKGISDGRERELVARRIVFLFQAGVECANKLSALLAHYRPADG